MIYVQVSFISLSHSNVPFAKTRQPRRPKNGNRESKINTVHVVVLHYIFYVYTLCTIIYTCVYEASYIYYIFILYCSKGTPYYFFIIDFLGTLW